MPRRIDRITGDENETLRRTVAGKADPSDAIDADDDDETRFRRPVVGVGGDTDDDDKYDDFSADTDNDTDDDTDDDFSADTDEDDTADDGTDDDTDDGTDEDDTDGGTKDTGTARTVNTPPRRRTLLERFTDSSSAEPSADTENEPLGLTDYKPVYNRLIDAIHNTPNDYETIARLFDDFTARLTGEYSEERVEDATRAIVELSSLVFGVVPYPYNSSILADLMELASYAGYADAQLLFYVWATVLDCAKLVRDYGYDEAIRRTFGVTRRVIQSFPEDKWQEVIRVFLGENDGTKTEQQQDISDGRSGKQGISDGRSWNRANEADTDSIESADSPDIERDSGTDEPESGTGTPTETPASAPKLLTSRGYDATDERASRSVPNYTPLGKRYEEDAP